MPVSIYACMPPSLICIDCWWGVAWPFHGLFCPLHSELLKFRSQSVRPVPGEQQSVRHHHQLKKNRPRSRLKAVQVPCGMAFLLPQGSIENQHLRCLMVLVLIFVVLLSNVEFELDTQHVVFIRLLGMIEHSAPHIGLPSPWKLLCGLGVSCLQFDLGGPFVPTKQLKMQLFICWTIRRWWQ